MQVEKYGQSDCKYIVDINLSKYFDTISKDRLVYKLKEQIKGKLVRFTLSLLLANIYLDEFDKRLKHRGIMFVRYAYDIQIHCNSLRGSHRVMDSTIKLLETKKK